MTNAPDTSATPEAALDRNSISGRASWGGSVASAEPAPEGAGKDLHRGAQVLEAPTEGGSEPEQQDLPIDARVRRQRAPRVRQRPRQSPEKKRLHQPNARFNDEEFALITSAASRCNLSVAGFLARSALTAARDLDRTSAEIADERDVITALFDSRRRLGWAGSNLNQAVRALNTGAEAPHLEAAISAVRRAADTTHDAAAQLIKRGS
ncbi:hypothetical protein [Streptomyces diastaticus]|uniref:hypothetical protein n=1 Tax=Streptomyces diastaticus TaxID=1956 RepID=UPI0036492AC8